MNEEMPRPQDPAPGAPRQQRHSPTRHPGGILDPLTGHVNTFCDSTQDTIGADAILSPPWRGDREADGDGLENRFRASERGFESHPLRRPTPPLPVRDAPSGFGGEIGGTIEQEAAWHIQSGMSKPVVAFVAGASAPPGQSSQERQAPSLVARSGQTRETARAPCIALPDRLRSSSEQPWHP